MELELTSVLKPGVELFTIKEFSSRLNVSCPAISYAVKRGHLDHIRVGNMVMIVNSSLTLQYFPKLHPSKS